jgi:hypothetical protein
MLLMKIITVYYEIHKKHINTLYGQNEEELIVKLGDALDFRRVYSVTQMRPAIFLQLKPTFCGSSTADIRNAISSTLTVRCLKFL